MENRFSYREWLSEYSLDIKLFDNYSFKVIDVIPLRKVFILITDMGDKILKKTCYGEKDICFMKSSIDYLKSNGFINTMDFVLNKKGHIFTKWGEDSYIVMDLIDGRECDYSNPLDIKMAIKSLSNMHEASRNIDFSSKSDRFMGFKLLNNLKYKLSDLEKLKKRAMEYDNKNQFEVIFLEYIDYFIDAMRKSILVIENSPYNDLCCEKKGYVLCHHDLAYHNVLIKDDEAYFIDLDYSIIDLRVHDLCNFINKVTKYSCYDYEVLNLILCEYNRNQSLTRNEYEVLYGFLLFPEGFYSVSRDYFYRKKLWNIETFVYKIQKKVQDIDEREDMLETFKKNYVEATF